MIDGTPIKAVELAETVQNKFRQKWDPLLPSDLLTESFASESFDIDGALDAIKANLLKPRE